MDDVTFRITANDGVTARLLVIKNDSPFDDLEPGTTEFEMFRLARTSEERFLEVYKVGTLHWLEGELTEEVNCSALEMTENMFDGLRGGVVETAVASPTR